MTNVTTFLLFGNQNNYKEHPTRNPINKQMNEDELITLQEVSILQRMPAVV